MATKHDVYEALKAHFAKSDKAPTQAQIEAAVGSHWLAVKQHLLRLQREGAVTWEPRDFSTLRLTSKKPKVDKNAAKTTEKRRTSKPVPTRSAKAASTAEVIAVPEQAPAVVEQLDLATPIERAYVDTSRLARARKLLIDAADELGAAFEEGLAPADYLRALAERIDVSRAPVQAATVVHVAAPAPAPRVSAPAKKADASTKRSARVTKRFRVEDGLGNELGAFAAISDARKQYDRDDDAVKIVDSVDGSIVASKRGPSDEEE